MKRTQDMDKLIGSHLRLQRGSVGLTQSEVGNMIGVTFQQVQKYENGTNRISLSTFAVWCKALGVSPSKMFEAICNDDRAATEPNRFSVTTLRAAHALNALPEGTQTPLGCIVIELADIFGRQGARHE